MNEHNIRHLLIQDLKYFSPELLSQAYHYFELLKATESKQSKTWKSYIGCISDKEASIQKEIINREFENIEGDW